jgi:hypothetical protein
MLNFEADHSPVWFTLLDNKRTQQLQQNRG